MANPSHFSPLRWEICLDFDSSALVGDPVAQATFTHEYIHYVQCLTGTVGRLILLDMVRVAVFAGLHKVHNGSIPARFQQIDLKQVFASASRSDFDGTDPALQYRELERELTFAFAAESEVCNTHPPGTLFSKRLSVRGLEVDDFVHVTAYTPAGVVCVPVSDRVVFENMARQVQRNFLLFAVGHSPIDDERSKNHGDAPYACLHDLIVSVLPSSEPYSKWTIAICQAALMCQHPGKAFEHIFGRLKLTRVHDLEGFVSALNRDSWFEGEFNVPDVQTTVNDLVRGYGTAMRPGENYELAELVRLVANAHNAIRSPWSYFANPLVKWNDVASWVRSFGCPPVRCNDRKILELHGISTSLPFQSYLQAAHELLGTP
jgi:hypothetical protein